MSCSKGKWIQWNSILNTMLSHAHVWRETLVLSALPILLSNVHLLNHSTICRRNLVLNSRAISLPDHSATSWCNLVLDSGTILMSNHSTICWCNLVLNVRAILTLNHSTIYSCTTILTLNNNGIWRNNSSVFTLNQISRFYIVLLTLDKIDTGSLLMTNYIDIILLLLLKEIHLLVSLLLNCFINGYYWHLFLQGGKLQSLLLSKQCINTFWIFLFLV